VITTSSMSSRSGRSRSDAEHHDVGLLGSAFEEHADLVDEVLDAPAARNRDVQRRLSRSGAGRAVREAGERALGEKVPRRHPALDEVSEEELVRVRGYPLRLPLGSGNTKTTVVPTGYGSR
jgi:hypothetical protein